MNFLIFIQRGIDAQNVLESVLFTESFFLQELKLFLELLFEIDEFIVLLLVQLFLLLEIGFLVLHETFAILEPFIVFLEAADC